MMQFLCDKLSLEDLIACANKRQLRCTYLYPFSISIYNHELMQPQSDRGIGCLEPVSY